MRFSTASLSFVYLGTCILAAPTSRVHHAALLRRDDTVSEIASAPSLDIASSPSPLKRERHWLFRRASPRSDIGVNVEEQATIAATDHSALPAAGNKASTSTHAGLSGSLLKTIEPLNVMEFHMNDEHSAAHRRYGSTNFLNIPQVEKTKLGSSVHGDASTGVGQISEAPSSEHGGNGEDGSPRPPLQPSYDDAMMYHPAESSAQSEEELKNAMSILNSDEWDSLEWNVKHDAYMVYKTNNPEVEDHALGPKIQQRIREMEKLETSDPESSSE